MTHRNSKFCLNIVATISKGILGVLLLILAAGCTSTKQHVGIPNLSRNLDNPERCRIYVIRCNDNMVTFPMEVRDDKILIGTLKTFSYLCWEGDPGKKNIISKIKNSYTFTLDAKKGETYYLVVQVRMVNGRVVTKLRQVNQASGREALQKCKAPNFAGPH